MERKNQPAFIAEDLNKIIGMVDDITDALSSKRVTLEEKMIVNYLKDLSTKSLSCLELLGKNGSESHLDEVLANLQELVFEIKASLTEFLKIINYNLNFLEQYFEHEYYEGLVYESKFCERMDDGRKLLLAQETTKDSKDA